MMQSLTPDRLSQENSVFAGTRGVSYNNRTGGFVPAFCNGDSGDVQIARFRNGLPAPMHLLDGLPDDWIQERLPSGRVTMVKASVVSGFLRHGRFYTREQAAAVAF